MLLVTAEEMRELDRATIEEIGIPGPVLMENAGLRLLEVAEEMLGEIAGKKVTIFVGKGNNGGDGLVLARHLVNRGAEVKVLLMCRPEEIKGDALLNLKIYQNMGQKVHQVLRDNGLNIVRLALFSSHLVVDAIFGTGFKGRVDDFTGRVIEIINSSQRPVLAVDIPSGLEANTGQVWGPCVKAAATVTFGLPKVGLVLYPGAEYTGTLYIADISIPRTVVDRYSIKRYLVTGERVAELLPARPAQGHKGTFGRVVVFAGSPGYTGAAVLTGNGAVRSGAGLVTVAVPQGVYPIVGTKLTEAMARPLPEGEKGTLSEKSWEEAREIAAAADVVAVGPGLGQGEDVLAFLRGLLAESEKPLVLDADGINNVAREPSLLESYRGEAVITPHPGEMARLLGMEIDAVNADRLGTALRAARRFGAVTVLKGARTVIATPEGKVYINPTGNSGMASGGTGDVLTGIIAGLMAQGLKAEEAAVAGVYLHGLAGDFAAAEKGEYSLAATDLLDFLPAAFCQLAEQN